MNISAFTWSLYKLISIYLEGSESVPGFDYVNLIFKKNTGVLPSPRSFPLVCVAEYASISLNIPKHL